MSDPPLPPHLEKLLRDQLAAGRFESEHEVIQAALNLLDEQSHSRNATAAWLKHELDKGLNSKPSEPLSPPFWEDLRERLRVAVGPEL